MTMAPSAASGNEASTGRANSRTPRIEASAVSEYAWVCAPAASPMAVLLPLLLIGKPRSRPAPAFDTPRASSSCVGVDALAAALERPPGQHVVAEGNQEHAQRGQYQLPYVSQVHLGQSRCRQACGDMPHQRHAVLPQAEDRADGGAQQHGDQRPG